MGYIRHHAIIVTDWRESVVRKAQELAVELGMDVSSVHQAPINENYSFCVFPDGSQEGWKESDEGDVRRARLIAALRRNLLTYVCVGYGAGSGDKVTYEASDGLNEEDEVDYSTEWKP